MKINERLWGYVQERLGYSDDEMAAFRAQPRNTDVLSRGLAQRKKTIVLEVVEAHGCNSGHAAGDRFYFDVQGNLLTAHSPERVCVHALGAMATLIYAAQELIYAGVDPNAMRFNRISCPDVGLACGGWGRVVLEIGLVDGPPGDADSSNG